MHGRWDPPYYRVRTAAFEADFLVGDGEDLDEVCNADTFLRLADGTLWSATILTVREVERLLDRWSATGDPTGGTYFACPDGLIVREPGIANMVEALTRLLDSSDLPHVLKPTDPQSGRQPLRPRRPRSLIRLRPARATNL
jgi:hypothetical protein